MDRGVRLHVERIRQLRSGPWRTQMKSFFALSTFPPFSFMALVQVLSDLIEIIERV